MRKVKVKIGEEMNIEESEGAPPGVVRPNNQLMLWTRTRESSSRPILRAEQKGPDFLKCSLKKDSQISNL